MRRSTHLAFVLTLLLATWSAAGAAAPAPPADVEFLPDITYATVEGEALQLNLAMPKDAKGALPCIVIIHGGAWRAGHRNAHNDLTWQFARRGYVAATVSYRFCPRHPFPAQVQDVKAAVRFLRANAEKYHVDPQRLGAIGFSAGAHLSMMLGTMDKSDGLDDVGDHRDQSSKVQAVVSFFGPADFNLPLPDASRGLVRDFLGGTKEEKAEAYTKASPVTYVDRSDAPMLLFQGTKDPLVPHEQAYAMVEAMTRAGVPGRLEILVGAGHGWGNPDLLRTAQASFAFFEQHLKGK